MFLSEILNRKAPCMQRMMEMKNTIYFTHRLLGAIFEGKFTSDSTENKSF